MKLEVFQMERMQSTYENLVEYDMSESGIQPLTLRELAAALGRAAAREMMARIRQSHAQSK